MNDVWELSRLTIKRFTKAVYKTKLAISTVGRCDMVGSPKLGDVAKAASLSSATVSRYLNGSLRLPPETSRRIEAAVATLGYRPHPHARSLSRGRSDTIGLLLPEIDNPFFSRLAAAVEAAAGARGLGLMFCASLNDPGREVDYIAHFRRNVVDGLLFATNHPDDGTLSRAVNAAPGIVLIDEDIAEAGVPKVFCDNEQGGRLAAEHLLGFGHTDLAYIGGPVGLMSARERGAAFAATVRGAGQRLAGECFGDYSRRHGETATIEILDRHPEVTAIFAGSDEILMGILSVLKGRELEVGADMSIVSFDDVGPLDLLATPITAIRQPVEEIGRLALDRMMGDRSQTGASVDRLAVSLVVRASVASPRRRAPRRHPATH